MDGASSALCAASVADYRAASVSSPVALTVETVLLSLHLVDMVNIRQTRTWSVQCLRSNSLAELMHETKNYDNMS